MEGKCILDRYVPAEPIERDGDKRDETDKEYQSCISVGGEHQCIREAEQHISAAKSQLQPS